MMSTDTEGLVNIDDVDLYYKIVGNSGEPLLMIMGLSFSHLDWGDRIVSLLSQHYRVILFDNRDSGRSDTVTQPYNISQMADDSAGLLSTLGVRKAHVFGVSMGGAIAQHLALSHESKVNRLILGCTTADTEGLGALSPEALAQPLGGLLFTPEYLEAHDTEIEAFIEDVSPYHSGPLALLRQLYAMGTHDTKSELDSISHETLVITGDRDIVIPSGKSIELDAGIPNSELSIIDDAAHGFTYSHADESYNLIHNFLQ
ncbi:MAG: alpha/beta hydrolase [Cyanobacteria bacterium P01_E01_bin.6]